MKRKIRLTESDLRDMVTESVRQIYRQSVNEGVFDVIDWVEEKLPWTDRHKVHKRAKAARERWAQEDAAYERRKAREREEEARKQREYEENRRRLQSSQRSQQSAPRQDIYSQTIRALNRGDHSFFNGRKDLQGILASLYNRNQITHGEYERGLEWIGLGYRYPGQ